MVEFGIGVVEEGKDYGVGELEVLWGWRREGGEFAEDSREGLLGMGTHWFSFSLQKRKGGGKIMGKRVQEF